MLAPFAVRAEKRDVRIGKKFEIDPAEAPTVRLIF
jgi:hypothetical protein